MDLTTVQSIQTTEGGSLSGRGLNPCAGLSTKDTRFGIGICICVCILYFVYVCSNNRIFFAIYAIVININPSGTLRLKYIFYNKFIDAGCLVAQPSDAIFLFFTLS